MDADGNAETRFELVARLAGEAMEAENNLQNAILKAGGREFIREGDRWKPVEPVAEREVPLPQTYQLATLAGLVAYLKSDIDETKKAGAIVHVVSPTKVLVVGPPVGFKLQRPVFAAASFSDDAHPWAQPQELESFQVWLRARFVPTDDSANLLKALSGVKDGEVKNVVDTGLSQEVSIKVGVDLTDRALIKNPVMLRPYRTFREVAQPQSEFVVRMTGNANGLPRVTLHEADGGTWKLEAILKVVQWLDWALNKNDDPKPFVVIG